MKRNEMNKHKKEIQLININKGKKIKNIYKKNKEKKSINN